MSSKGCQKFKFFCRWFPRGFCPPDSVMAEPGGGGGEGEELVECVVEFDYTAELNDELTLRVSEDIVCFLSPFALCL